MSRYDAQDLGLGGLLALLGLVGGLVSGAALAERSRPEPAPELEAATALPAPAVVEATTSRPCAVLPAVDSRVGLGSADGWLSLGYTSRCRGVGPVTVTLVDPAEQTYRSVRFDGGSPVTSTPVPMPDDVMRGRWTVRVEGEAASSAVTEVRLASRLTVDDEGRVSVTVYDPARGGFRPWATDVELQRLTPSGWRRSGGTVTGADGTGRLALPTQPGRYRAVTFDRADVFGSVAALPTVVDGQSRPHGPVVQAAG